MTENKYDTSDSLKAIHDSIQQASDDSIKKANRIELLKKLYV